MRARFAVCLATALVVSSGVVRAGRPSLPGWFDLPVPGGAATLAALGVTENERALTLILLARALDDRETLSATPAVVNQLMAVATMPSLGRDEAGETIEIPAPLDEATWRELLELPADADLFGRLITDRAALLLAAALTATDATIRALVVHDRNLLRFLYREGYGGFALASRALAVDDGQIVVPGREMGRKVWPRLIGQPLDSPASFIRALVTRDRGRLAWYLDAIHGLDDNRIDAAWPGTTDEERLHAAQALYEVFRDIDSHWRANEQPYRRAQADAWMIVALIDVAGGEPVASLSTGVWQRLFRLDPIDRETALQLMARDGGRRLTLPTLARMIAFSPPRDRRRQFEMFRLAQRVFAHDASAETVAALSGYDRFSSLLTALERMGIVSPETWATAVAAAKHVSDDADDTRQAVAVFQAAIAIVDRLRHVRTLDVEATDQTIRALSASVGDNRNVVAAVAGWLVDDLMTRLPALEQPDAWTGRTAYESRLLQALAGRRDTRAPTLHWEGLTYIVDVVSAEHARLAAIRRLVPSPGLDAALARRRGPDVGNALTALVYTGALGHPEGAAALGRDVGTRHDFGLNGSSLMRRFVPWSPPEERQGHGPWHVVGSLIGLEAGLSRLALRRVADNEMPQSPTLTLNDLGMLTRTRVALVPSDLSDTDRDAIAAAIVRGRQRVRDAREDLAELDRLARQVRMSAAARALLPWIVAHQPDAVTPYFSLRDFLWLGGVPAIPIDRWGVAGDALDGRRGLAMPPPAPWEDFAGRPDTGLIMTQVPDLTLRLVEESARMNVPASLIPSLLAYAIDDFWHGVQARFSDDWPRMIRQAAALHGSRIEDYVAALVGDNVLRPQ